MVPDPPVIAAGLVATQAGLDAAVAHLRTAAVIALDTEFMRERTYYPKLCLLQIAGAGRIYCIDPLVGLDLSQVLALIADPHVLKVLHSARQDLEIFHTLLDTVPGPLFDTQIAAAFCAFPDQLGYAGLVAELCGAQLDKSHTRTDWARRPLSLAQVTYAGDDVRYLETAADMLRERLRASGRLAWLEEDCERLRDPALYAPPLQEMWRRIKGSSALPPLARAALCRLAGWREQTARATDRPRGWVISDADLLVIANQRPTSVAQLLALQDINSGAIARDAEKLVELASLPPDAALLHQIETDETVVVTRAQVNEWLAWLRDRCLPSGLTPQLVASRRDIELALTGNRALPLFEGWRRDFAGAELATLLANRQPGATIGFDYR